MHEAWHITWAASDTSTMSPTLPEITADMLIGSWVPGQSLSPGAYDREHPIEGGPQYLSPSLYWFLVIGIPIIFLLLVGYCIRCCVVFHRVKKTERRERWLAEHELTTNVVDSQGK